MHPLQNVFTFHEDDKVYWMFNGSQHQHYVFQKLCHDHHD